jgi:peptidoglycan/LPS O-acetylase OafA/YrhL
MSTTTAPSPAGPRAAQHARVSLAHEPALDGLRGLAVTAVVVFHLGHLRGGFLGVDLFFVLSGYLITSLLLAEHGTTGAIDVGRFWARRARRLLPALLLMLVGVAVLLLRFTPEPVRVGLRGDALATLGYVANWHQMVGRLGYWDQFTQPSPLDHTWSLAIEEQFYLLWPLLAIVVLGSWPRRRPADGVLPTHQQRRLGIVALAGAAVSLLLLAATYSPLGTNRAYFATDTRIGPTLLGAALAALTAGRPRRQDAPSTALELVALVALAWMAVSTFVVDGIDAWYYRGGLVAFALAGSVVVFVVTGRPPGLVARAVSARPLRALGVISYGVYLWHWPVIVYTTPGRAHLNGLALDALRVALTIAIAVVSYGLVEAPIRRGALTGPRIKVSVATALAVTLGAVMIATTGTPAPTEAAPHGRELAGTDNAFLHIPAEVPPGTPRLLLVGDSGVEATGPVVVEEGERSGVAVGFSAQIWCAVIYTDDIAKLPDGHVAHRPPCTSPRRRVWADIIDQFDPDVVVYYLANAGGLDRERLDGQWVWDCDPSYDEYLQAALSDDVEVLAENGATVVVTTSPYVGYPEPTSGHRVDCRNATYQTVVATHPRTRLADLNAFVRHEIDTTDIDMFSDPVHLSEEGSRVVARWLFATLPELHAPASPTVPTTSS